MNDLKRFMLGLCLWITAELAWYSLFMVAYWTPVVPYWDGGARFLWWLGVLFISAAISAVTIFGEDT